MADAAAKAESGACRQERNREQKNRRPQMTPMSADEQGNILRNLCTNKRLHSHTPKCLLKDNVFAAQQCRER